MGRKYDLVDVMAAVGLVATLFGGYLLVTAADGFWQAPISPTMNSVIAGNEPSTGMQYLQPVLGQAIVQDLLLDRDAGAALSASAMELNRAVGESERIFTALLSPLVLAELRAFGQETDHRARMQYVMGKSIVNQTRRGIAAGILSADQYGGEFNTNLIRTAELTWEAFRETVTAPRVIASYRLTFGASLLAALTNAVFGLLVAWVLVRYRFPGRRLMDAVGWAGILPQMLASLGAVFAIAGVGDVVGRLMAGVIPDGSRLAAVLAYGLGMALFTMAMGNAFAAFPVMAAAIGMPLLIHQYHGDPAIVAAIGMLAGFCGTLMTPMAANFNVVPAALLDLPDRNAVVKAQVGTALPLLAINIALIYFLAFP